MKRLIQGAPLAKQSGTPTLHYSVAPLLHYSVIPVEHQLDLLFAICYLLFFSRGLRACRKELRIVNPAIVRCVGTIRVFAVDIDETVIP
jgi:hypothetical protein